VTRPLAISSGNLPRATFPRFTVSNCRAATLTSGMLQFFWNWDPEQGMVFTLRGATSVYYVVT
jgi:hypothetical protein